MLLFALCSFYHLNAGDPIVWIGQQILQAIMDEKDNIERMGNARRVLDYLCDRKQSKLDTETLKALEKYGLIDDKGGVDIRIAAYQVRQQYTHSGLIYTMKRIN